MNKNALILDTLIAFVVLIIGVILLSTVLHDRFVVLSADIPDILPAEINSLLDKVRGIF